MFYIFNIRDGFANNSSSTHSIILSDKPLNKIDNNYNDELFGWDYFTVAGKQSILDYLRATLCSNLNYKLNSEYIRCIVDNWIGESYNYNDDDYSEFPVVDHQSCIMLPLTFDESGLDKRFFLELKELLLRDNILILGGNDNDEEDHPLSGYGEHMSFITDRRSMIAKKSNHDYWTLFDRDYGTKIRLKFSDSGQEFIKPTKSLTPDLVDVCITSFCHFNCSFCLVEGTNISTDRGLVPIELINIGDVVNSFDVESQEYVLNEVEQIFKRTYDGDLIDIELEDGTIISITPNHEIYTKNRGWILADELTINDDILYINT